MTVSVIFYCYGRAKEGIKKLYFSKGVHFYEAEICRCLSDYCLIVVRL